MVLFGNIYKVYDSMTEVTFDESRGIEYPAMTTIRHNSISKLDDYIQRTKAVNAIPVIYPMVASEAINSESHFLVRDLIRKDMVHLLCTPNDGEEFLISNARYFDAKKDIHNLGVFMRPYYQASALQSEMTSLKPTFSGNQVKLEEPSGGRKDRYMALAYGCWFTKVVLDPNIVKERQNIDYTQQVMVANGSGTANRFSAPQRFGGGNNFARRPLFGR